ncbi:Alpha/Beta hydrolase protein [Chytriomyces sp. MP71]|nr:Alpha/Beta hydrolase protein [Chytriomyces sp. MP71]
MAPTADNKWRNIRKLPFDIARDSVPDGGFMASKLDGHQVFYKVWKPTGPVKAQLLFFHGLGEHVLRYDAIFERFARAGILVRGMDARGHGRTAKKSGGTGHARSFNAIFDDMLQLLGLDVTLKASDSQSLRGIPLFVGGHSMGGLLALSFVLTRKHQLPNLRGCISQAPALGVAPVHWFLKLLVMFLGRFWLINWITQPNNLALAGLCSHEPVIIDYVKDPLVHGIISIALAREIFIYQKLVLSKAREFTIPLITYHSSLDKFTYANASEQFVVEAASKDKKLKIIPASEALEHEIHNEPSAKDRIVEDYIEWIMERSK